MSNGKKTKGTKDGSTNTDVANSITIATIIADRTFRFSFKHFAKSPKNNGKKA